MFLFMAGLSKIDEMLLLATAITPITTGVLQVVKKATALDNRFIPLLAIIIGLVLGGLATFIDGDFYMRLWIGLISGLASVGLFEYISDENNLDNGGN